MDNQPPPKPPPAEAEPPKGRDAPRAAFPHLKDKTQGFSDTETPSPLANSGDDGDADY